MPPETRAALPSSFTFKNGDTMSITDTGLVTRIHIEGGACIRASEGIDHVATLVSTPDNGWFIVQDPGTGLEKYVLSARVLWLEQEDGDA